MTAAALTEESAPTCPARSRATSAGAPATAASRTRWPAGRGSPAAPQSPQRAPRLRSGTGLPAPAGPEVVTGRAAFTLDTSIPGLLHMKLARSPHPHARIRSVDATCGAGAARGGRRVQLRRLAPRRATPPRRHHHPDDDACDTVLFDRTRAVRRPAGRRGRRREPGHRRRAPCVADQRGLRRAAGGRRTPIRPWRAGAPVLHAGLRPAAGPAGPGAQRGGGGARRHRGRRRGLRRGGRGVRADVPGAAGAACAPGDARHDRLAGRGPAGAADQLADPVPDPGRAVPAVRPGPQPGPGVRGPDRRRFRRQAGDAHRGRGRAGRAPARPPGAAGVHPGGAVHRGHHPAPDADHGAARGPAGRHADRDAAAHGRGHRRVRQPRRRRAVPQLQRGDQPVPLPEQAGRRVVRLHQHRPGRARSAATACPSPRSRWSRPWTSWPGSLGLDPLASAAATWSAPATRCCPSATSRTTCRSPATGWTSASTWCRPRWPAGAACRCPAGDGWRTGTGHRGHACWTRCRPAATGRTCGSPSGAAAATGWPSARPSSATGPPPCTGSSPRARWAAAWTTSRSCRPTPTRSSTTPGRTGPPARSWPGWPRCGPPRRWPRRARPGRALPADGKLMEAEGTSDGRGRSVTFNVQGFRVAVRPATGEIAILQSVQAADAGTVINPVQLPRPDRGRRGAGARRGAVRARGHRRGRAGDHADVAGVSRPGAGRRAARPRCTSPGPPTRSARSARSR